jgi:hypothetical protein
VGGRELQLDLPGGAMNARTVSEALTPPLEDALLKSPDSATASRRIAASPSLLLAARNCLSLVERLSAPVGREGPDGIAPGEVIYAVLQPCLILWGPPQFGSDDTGEALSRMWLGLYTKALGEFPREALDLAVDDWIASGYHKFPLPSDLVKRAEREASEIRLIAYRLRKAVAKAAEARPPERRPEDRAAVKAMLADLRDPVTGRIRLTKAP